MRCLVAGISVRHVESMRGELATKVIAGTHMPDDSPLLRARRKRSGGLVMCVLPHAGGLVEIVGREPERAELMAALSDVIRGHGRTLLVLGEAGLGKSVLADWLVKYAWSEGFRCGRGYCSAAGMPPLWPWRQALDGMAAGLSWRAGGRDPTAEGRDLVAAEVVEAIGEIARDQPLLIVIEDLHWSDPASLLVVRAVADAVAGLPVMLLLTCRDDLAAAAGDVRDQLADLPTSVRRVLLPPLDLPGVARLAAGGLGYELPETAVRDLHARTGGNPFFVHEVTRLMVARGPVAAMVVPPGVLEVLQRRVARLSQPCASFVTAAAVAAETSADAIEDDLLGVVRETDEVTAARLLDEAVAARLADFDPASVPRYRFRHTLVREVLVQALSGVERGRLHEAVAKALENRSDRSNLAPRLAHHWSRAIGAGARERAASWSLLAAREALAGFGFEAAATHYARALTEPSTDPIAVSIEYGAALQLAGDATRAREVLLRAARAASAAARPVDLAQAALALGGGLAGFEVPIHDDDQADLLREADATLSAADVALRAAVRGRLSLALAGTAPMADRVALAQDAVRLAREAGDPEIESAVLAAYCDAIAGPDYVSDRIAAATRMLNLAEAMSGSGLRQHATVLLAHRLLLVAYLERADLAEAEQHAVAYERVTRRLKIPRYAWLPEIWRGMRALLNGDPELALQHAAVAAEIGHRADSFNAELMVFTVRMQAHLDLGTADQFTDDVITLLAELGPGGFTAMYYAGPARLLLAAGDAGHARAVLRAFLTGSPESMPKDAEWLEAHWAMAEMAVQLDDQLAAAALFEALQPYAQLWAVDGIGAAVFGSVAEQLGRLADYLGRPDESTRYRGMAREQYARVDAPALLHRIDSMTTRSPALGLPVAGSLHRDGKVWLVEWRGRRSTVADSKGLRDLAVLLARPGQAVPALELVEAAGGPPAAAAGADLGPVLDDTARRAYRRRLGELDQELAAADANADLARAERLRTERSLLIDQLASAFGLGGRPRIAGDPVDRARKAVTMRIRAAITMIGRQDDALGRHLNLAVRTGRVCSYQPDGPVSWRT